MTYPIVNEPLSLDMNIWAPLGFPTVNVIRPSDYEIVLDTYNLYSLEEQVDAINGALSMALSWARPTQVIWPRVAETVTCTPTLRTASLRWP